MKKIILLLAVLVLAVGWFAKKWFSPPAAPAKSLASAPPRAPERSVEAPPPKESVTLPTLPVPSVRTPVAAAERGRPLEMPVSPESRKTVTVATGPYPQMSLSEVLKPGNVFHDAVFGVSATYPEGWSVKQAMRWGENNRENTIFFSGPEGSQATPSMYYQMYPESQPVTGNAEAILRDMAQKKEESRSRGGTNDYTNDPGSFVFRDINGQPSLSYFATYTQGEQVMAEYFMRILGPKGYVMFFVRGPATDVQAIIPDVHQVGGTVKAP